eukprot:1461339-Pyramimonas_sp.AAC.1
MALAEKKCTRPSDARISTYSASWSFGLSSPKHEAHWVWIRILPQKARCYPYPVRLGPAAPLPRKSKTHWIWI